MTAKLKGNTMLKFYRGTCQREAAELANDTQTREVTHWTDSKEKAAMYSKGAIIEVTLDEQSPGLQHYFGIAHGDATHGNIHEWKLPREYFQDVFSCYVEEVAIHNH